MSSNLFYQFRHKQLKYLFTMHIYAVRLCLESNLLGSFLIPGRGCHQSRLHRAPVRTLLGRLASFSSSRAQGSLTSDMSMDAEACLGLSDTYEMLAYC